MCQRALGLCEGVESLFHTAGGKGREREGSFSLWMMSCIFYWACCKRALEWVLRGVLTVYCFQGFHNSIPLRSDQWKRYHATRIFFNGPILSLFSDLLTLNCSGAASDY